MNLIYGKIADVFTEDGLRMGTVLAGGAMRKVTLELLTDAQPGDRVLLCDGVAISKEEERHHVSSHPRETD